MTSEDFDFLCTMLKTRSGLIIGPDKAYLVESRLSQIARREGHASVEALLFALRTRREERIMALVTDAMTTNETFFFRDKTPFDQMKQEVLPKLYRARSSGEIKVLSAACSTGQEPYSLAMMIDEERATYPRLNVSIQGIDISDRCLEKAQSGLYSQFEVQRGLPIQLLVKNFSKVDDMWRLNDRIKMTVRFRKFNLLDETRTLGNFDVIFIRNVLIYFDQPTKKRILENLSQQLADDGYLFLGAAETVLGITDTLKPVSGHRGLYAKNLDQGVNTYRRASGF